MPTVTAADTFNSLRGFTSWSALAEGDRSTALYRASDYIQAHYSRLRAPANPAEQVLLDAATYTIARDLATNPAPVRATAAVKKESKELSGMKKSVEYGDAPTDPYPQVTAMLAVLLPPVIVTTPGAGYYSGRQAV